MNYKELLESGEPIYHESERFKHFKNPATSERYFANYISYKRMPSLSDLEADLAYLAQEQARYISDYALLFFVENEELSVEMADYLKKLGFDCCKHLIFTSPVEDLQLTLRDLGGIRIVELSEEYLEAYLEASYQHHLQYGSAYADQMLADNRTHLLTNDSKVYLALEGSRIVGSVTAWFFGDYVEIDDYQVDEAYQGRGIGTALQLAALKNQKQAILIAEEVNRAMYHHQGYEEVAFYWTSLRSNSRHRTDH